MAKVGERFLGARPMSPSDARPRQFLVFLKEGNGVVTAEVPQLPGCQARADSRESALSGIRDAIKLYLLDREAPASITVERVRVRA